MAGMGFGAKTPKGRKDFCFLFSEFQLFVSAFDLCLPASAPSVFSGANSAALVF